MCDKKKKACWLFAQLIQNYYVNDMFIRNIYAYMHTCRCEAMHGYILVYVGHKYTYYTYICIYVCMYVSVCIYTVSKYAFRFVYGQTHISTYIGKYVYIYIHILQTSMHTCVYV